MLTALFKAPLKVISLLFGLLLSCNLYAAVETYNFSNELERKRYNTFIEELRCPKCQNQNLAGSDSPIASDLRKELYRMVQSGKSDTEIVDFMVARYGEFVLYRPRMTLKTLVLWLAPVLFLLVGLAWVIWIVRKQKNTSLAESFNANESRAIDKMLNADASTLTQRQQQNLALYQMRLDELNDQLDSASIDKADFEALTLEAKRNLLNDSNVDESSEATTGRSSKGAKLVVGLCIVMLPVAVWGIYQKIGAAPDLEIKQKIDDFYLLREQSTDKKQLLEAQNELVTLMEARVVSAPHKLEYAGLLAQIYSQRSEYLKAAEYHSILAKAEPENPAVHAQLAQSLYFANNRKMTSSVAKAMDKTLSLDPKNPVVLGLQGIHFFTEKQYQSALNAWQTLLSTLPPNSPQARLIERGIMQAQLKLAVNQPAQSAPESDRQLKNKPIENQGKQIIVSVNVPPNVLTAKGVTANTAVFIWAKALVGPPMPLAIKRLRVANLPTTVALDDSTAMMENMKLSAFDEVEVIARVSLSGETKAQSGDFEARSGKITLSDKPVSISLSPETVIP